VTLTDYLLLGTIAAAFILMLIADRRL